MGVLHRWDGRMGGWVDDGKSLSFILPPSSNDVAVDLPCLSSSGQSLHTGAQYQIKSHPHFIYPKVHPVFSYCLKREMVFIGKPVTCGMVWTYGNYHSWLIPEEDKRCIVQ